MACFLGCFGFSSKRKHRRPANKVQPGDHRLISYEPLDSHESTEPNNSNSKLSDKSKNGSSSSIKIKKKVSFNLNVRAYEPLPPEEFSREISPSTMAPCDSSNRDKKTVESGNARIRSQYVSSVLNPVENISQWKAVKARAAKYLLIQSRIVTTTQSHYSRMLRLMLVSQSG